MARYRINSDPIDNRAYGASRPESDIKALLLHHTAGNNPGDYAVLDGHTDREVSVHYWVPDYDDADGGKYVDEDGTHVILQFVPITRVAWHAGKALAGRGNSNTVGIEMGNNGTERYGVAQLEALDWLIGHIDADLGHKVPIYSHAEVALPKGRKSDPGKAFPLAAYKQYRRHAAPSGGTPPKPPAAPKPKPPTPKPPAKSYGILGRVLRDRTPMMVGDDVRRVQLSLRDHGFPLVADRKFGGDTDRQVRRFQASRRLDADGIVGENTASALGLTWEGK